MPATVFLVFLLLAGCCRSPDLTVAEMVLVVGTGSLDRRGPALAPGCRAGRAVSPGQAAGGASSLGRRTRL